MVVIAVGWDTRSVSAVKRRAGGAGSVPPSMVRQAPSYTWSAERVLDALRDWANSVGEAPRIHEWCPASARSLGVDSRRSRLWEEQHPRWPSATTVVGYHGSWRAALLAAGLPADRPPLELSVNERVGAAQRLDAAGMSQVAIAAELQLHPRTVRRYLRASLCGCGQGWVVKGTVCLACAQELAVRRAPWTAVEVKQAIIDWAMLEGGPPSMADWKQGRNARGRWKSEYPRWPSAHVAARLFGSEAATLRAVECPRVRGHLIAWVCPTGLEGCGVHAKDASAVSRGVPS